MNMEEARKACKNGAIAAFISGTLTTFVVGIAMLDESNGELALWNDPSNFVDIVLIFGCAAAMLKNSRTAAITIFIYFIIAKAAISLETGQTSGMAISLLFLFYFGRAIQGSFAYKKLKREENPDYRSAPPWAYWLSIPTMLLFFVAAGYGVLSMTDVVPATEIVAGSEVSEKDRALMVQNGIIYDDETIELFYSYGITSILEGGTVLSDRAVIMYYTDEDDGFNVYEITFDQIASIELLEAGDVWTESVYQVSGFEEDNWLTISLSTEDDGDQRFIEALQERTSIQASNTQSE